MRVECDRPFRTRRGEIGHDHGRRAFHGEQLRGEAALFAQGANRLCVPINVRRVRGEIWNRKQFDELGQDFALMSRAPGARLFCHGGRLGQRRRVDERDGCDENCFHFSVWRCRVDLDDNSPAFQRWDYDCSHQTESRAGTQGALTIEVREETKPVPSVPGGTGIFFVIGSQR